MQSPDSGMTTYKNEEDHKAEIEELGLRFQYGCYMDKLPESCFSLGTWFQTYKENFTKSLEVFQMNCEKYNHAESCLKYAIHLFYGDGTKPNQMSAYNVFEKNCLKNNHRKSCHAAGVMLANGLVSHKSDFKGALEYFKKGCDLDFDSSCFHAGLLTMKDSDDLKQDWEKTARFLTKACDMGHFRACRNLALMHKNGDYFEKSEKKFNEIMTNSAQFADSCDIPTLNIKK